MADGGDVLEFTDLEAGGVGSLPSQAHAGWAPSTTSVAGA